MERFKWITFFVIIFCIIVVQLRGETIRKTVDSRIDKVTVYQNRAIVSRKGVVKCEPGFYSLLFKHLPSRLNNDSIRVSGKGTAVSTILNVQTEVVYLNKSFQKQANELAKKASELTMKKTVLDDRLKILEKRENFFLILAKKKAEALAKEKNVKLFVKEEWQRMMDFYEEQLQKIAFRRHALKQDIQKLDQAISLNDLKSGQNRNGALKVEKLVKVDIEAREKGELILELSYQVNNGYWQPLYDLRLSSADDKGVLLYSAVVNQSTGEDWQNVHLTLSTAKQFSMKEMPKLDPVYMDIYNITGQAGICGHVQLEDGSVIPGVLVSLSGSHISNKNITVSDENGSFCFKNLQPGTYDISCELEGFKKTHIKNIRARKGKTANLVMHMSTTQLREQIIITGKSASIDVRYTSVGVNIHKEVADSFASTTKQYALTRSSTNIMDKGISTSFRVKHRSNIKSGKSQKVTVMVYPLELKKELFAVPKISETVYLKAKLKNRSDGPFLPGKLSLFYDGAFLNKTYMPLVSSGDHFELMVGVDEAIKIKHEIFKEKTDSKALIGKKRIEHSGYTITMENLRKKESNLVVMDQIPVSIEKKIVVELEKMVPQPIREKKENKKGLYKWQIKLKPGEKREIQVKYTVKYPKGIIVKEVSEIKE